MIYCGIIDPFVSSQYLAEVLNAQKIQLVALLTDADQAKSLEASHRFQAENFAQVINIANLNDNQIVEQVKAFKPRIIMPGSEFSCAIADRIASKLTPEFANPPSSSHLRFNKAAAQTALAKAGIPVARSESITATNHLKLKKQLQNWDWPVVIKPAETGGSFGVKICHDFHEAEQQVKRVFNAEKFSLAKEPVRMLLLQAFLEGEEYFINSCSHQGQHRLASFAHYKKALHNDLPIYRYLEFKDFDNKEGQILSAYLKRVLSAIELHNGLAHTEIMLTKKGPRLIEVNPRISGAHGLVNLLANKVYHGDQVTLLAQLIKHSTNFLAHAAAIPTFHCYGRLVFLHCFEKRKIKDLKYSLINKLTSYKDHLLLKKPGTLISGEATLFETVVIVQLLHKNPEIVSADTEQLFQYEKKGELF